MSYVTSRHDPAREAEGTARLDDSISQPIRFLEMTFVLLKVNPVHFLHRDSISIHYKSLDSCWRRSLFERPALTHFSGGSIQKVFSVSLRSLVRLFSPCKGLNRYILESQQFNTINIGHCHQCAGQT